MVYPDAEAKLPWAAPTEAAPANALMWCWTKAADVAGAHSRHSRRSLSGRRRG